MLLIFCLPSKPPNCTIEGIRVHTFCNYISGLYIASPHSANAWERASVLSSTYTLLIAQVLRTLLYSSVPFGKKRNLIRAPFAAYERVFFYVILPIEMVYRFRVPWRLSRNKIPNQDSPEGGGGGGLRRGRRYRNLDGRRIVNPGSLDILVAEARFARSIPRPITSFPFFFSLLSSIAPHDSRSRLSHECKRPATDYPFSLADCCNIW